MDELVSKYRTPANIHAGYDFLGLLASARERDTKPSGLE